MKIQLIDSSRIIISNPDSLHNYFAWPSVARMKNGKIAVVSSGFRLAHVCPFGKAVISYSEDEGESYTLPAPIIDTPLDDRDAGILAFGEKSVIVTSFNNSTAFQRQISNEPYRLEYLNRISQRQEAEYLGATFRISHDNGVTFSKTHKSPITSPHGPCVLKDGTLLWVGRAFSHNDSLAEEKKEGIFAYNLKLDGSMECIGAIENIPSDGERLLSCEPHAIELDNGRIICHIRVQRNGENRVFTLYQSESDDHGRTWTKPHQLLSTLGGAPAHLMKHSSGMLISVYGYREQPYGIKAMFSEDGGKTWDTDNIIYTNDVGIDIGYPASIELSDGSILTVFYDHPDKDSPAVIIQQKWRFEK